MNTGVVVVGAGHAGVQAATSLRERGYAGRITVLGKEPDHPYERPPLSKAWLKGSASSSDLWFRDSAVYADQAIDLRTGVEALRIDRERRVLDTTEGALGYEHLVLATGARPRRLPVPGADLAGVHSLHDLRQATELLERLGRARRVAVIGGGFIGLEVASAARARGLDVHVLEAGNRIMQRAVSPDTSAFFEELHRAAGTTLSCNALVESIAGTEGAADSVRLSDGSRVPADLVVIGVGVAPVVGLAETAGLRCEDGIVVDANLTTSDPRISAIGDCASFPRPDGKHTRLESVQNAVDQAHAVAARLTGYPAPYVEVPWFWTEQHGCRLQIAGLTAQSDQWVLVGRAAERRFSTLCWRDGRLVGGESVNKPGDHVALRKLLAQGTGLAPDVASAPGFQLKGHIRALSTLQA